MTNDDRDTAIATMQVQVMDMHKAIMGNGQPGLLDRMARTETALRDVSKRQDECPAREAQTGAARRTHNQNLIALAACLVSVVAVLVHFIK